MPGLFPFQLSFSIQSLIAFCICMVPCLCNILWTWNLYTAKSTLAALCRGGGGGGGVWHLLSKLWYSKLRQIPTQFYCCFLLWSCNHNKSMPNIQSFLLILLIWQSYDSPVTIGITMKDMSKIDHYRTTTRHIKPSAKCFYSRDVLYISVRLNH